MRPAWAHDDDGRAFQGLWLGTDASEPRPKEQTSVRCQNALGTGWILWMNHRPKSALGTRQSEPVSRQMNHRPKSEIEAGLCLSP